MPFKYGKFLLVFNKANASSIYYSNLPDNHVLLRIFLRLIIIYFTHMRKWEDENYSAIGQINYFLESLLKYMFHSL